MSSTRNRPAHAMTLQRSMRKELEESYTASHPIELSLLVIHVILSSCRLHITCSDARLVVVVTTVAGRLTLLKALLLHLLVVHHATGLLHKLAHRRVALAAAL